MAKARYTGFDAVVRVNDNDDGSTFKDVGILINWTPPPQVKAIIDVTGAEDARFEGAVGGEEQSVFEFQEAHDPDDATDTAIDTLYGSGDQVKWQLDVTDGTTVWTMEFEGIVFGLTPQGSDRGTRVARQVQVLRKTAITDTSA